MLYEKKCSKCKETKHIIYFGSNRASKDGYCIYCKECNTLLYNEMKKKSLKQKVLKKYNNACAICKSKDNLIIHHVIPHSKGGRNVEWNLIVLCNDCHFEHGHKKDYMKPNGKCLEYLK